MGLWINTTDTLNQHIVSLRETASVAPLILENSLANVSLLCYAKSLQSCPTLCDPIDGSPPVSPDPGILQARTLEWVAIYFSNA